MGRFFNEVISKMPKFPIGIMGRRGSLEELRRNFNAEPTIKEKRIANLAKAREAKKKKNV